MKNSGRSFNRVSGKGRKPAGGNGDQGGGFNSLGGTRVRGEIPPQQDASRKHTGRTLSPKRLHK